MKRVAIFGGGIGGLTVAHELAKLPNYEINIYEKKDDIGGLARSGRDSDLCAQERCWRVYFGFYDNLLKTFSEIPKPNVKNKSILDNLTVYLHENIIDSPLSITDKLAVYYNVLYGLTSSDNRLNKLDNLAWWDALGTIKESNMYRAIGQWLGMDRNKGSYKSVIKIGMEQQILPSYLSSNYKDYVTTAPTSEAFFYPWKAHLESKGVKIHLNNELQTISISNNKVINATVYDSTTKKNNIIKADYYIFNLPVEVLDIIINKTPQLNHGDFKNIHELKSKSLHLQQSFHLYFNKHISLGSKNAFLLVDSPWDLIILSYDTIYKDTKLCNKLPNVKGGWSVAACTAYIPGKLINKPMNQCSYDEIIVELWHQLSTSKALQEFIYKHNKFYLTKDLIVKWTPIWPTFKYENGKLETSEPKFTNNYGTAVLRPSFKTHIDNLFVSTAYIKETIDILVWRRQI